MRRAFKAAVVIGLTYTALAIVAALAHAAIR